MFSSCYSVYLFLYISLHDHEQSLLDNALNKLVVCVIQKGNLPVAARQMSLYLERLV